MFSKPTSSEKPQSPSTRKNLSTQNSSSNFCQWTAKIKKASHQLNSLIMEASNTLPNFVKTNFQQPQEKATTTKELADNLEAIEIIPSEQPTSTNTPSPITNISKEFPKVLSNLNDLEEIPLDDPKRKTRIESLLAHLVEIKNALKPLLPSQPKKVQARIKKAWFNFVQAIKDFLSPPAKDRPKRTSMPEPQEILDDLIKRNPQFKNLEDL